MKWLARLRASFQPKSLGRRGERFAVRWLQGQGYRIVASNLSIRKDEADIVAVHNDGRTLVIVEVKTRSSEHHAPELSINRSKQFHLARLASRMLKKREFRQCTVRFDVIAIIWPPGKDPLMRHHPGAFNSPF